MTTSDPISDMLTRIRNASRMQHDVVEMPDAKLKDSIAQVLKDEGYIGDFEVKEGEGVEKTLSIKLKYNDEEEVIKGIKRVSKPSKRVYVSSDEIPQVLGGLGTSVLSTSHGVTTGKAAKEEGVGGELLLEVW
ncbi:30S ribosomal protein S8 [Candidatus Bipolaricaulota bacterium]|nr:30S ribosomal protein S8 [Candidatus Bipolaricaulota bacterium]